MTSIWVFRGWFSSQFGKIYEKMNDVQKNILDKLEYHERHDDARFADVQNQMWQVRFDLAGKTFDKEAIRGKAGAQSSS